MGWRLLFVHYTVLVYIKSIKILRKLMADIYTNEDKDLFCAWFISNHAINYTLSFWLGVFSYRQKVDHALHSANCQSQSAFARNVEVFIDVFQLYVVFVYKVTWSNLSTRKSRKSAIYGVSRNKCNSLPMRSMRLHS